MAGGGGGQRGGVGFHDLHRSLSERQAAIHQGLDTISRQASFSGTAADLVFAQQGGGIRLLRLTSWSSSGNRRSGGGDGHLIGWSGGRGRPGLCLVSHRLILNRGEDFCSCAHTTDCTPER